MTGKDGRFYDPCFDMNRDGKLDIAEFMLMEEVLFGDEKDEEDEDEDW